MFGWCRWHGRGACCLLYRGILPKEEEKKLLEERLKLMEKEIERIKARIEELEK